MKTALLMLAALLLSPGQDKTTYTNADLNLTFTYPKTWMLSTKGTDASLIIAAPDSEAAALLEIRSIYYFQDKARWNETQADLAKVERKTLVEQTEETLLGVPLLLTKTEWSEEGFEKARLGGLMYSATRKKLAFYLTAEKKYMPWAEEQLKAMLADLKTTDGKLPEPEDPSREKSAAELRDMDVKHIPLVMKPSKSDKVILAEQSIATKSGGLDVTLRMPTGWTAQPNDDGSFTIKNPGAKATLKLNVLSTLDSPPAEKSLLKAASETLSKFKEVKNRVDKRINSNRAGARVWWVARSGANETGPLFVYHAAGEKGYFYWLLSGEWHDEATFRADSKLLDALVQAMSVEPNQ
jgi:hypothetical protein